MRDKKTKPTVEAFDVTAEYQAQVAPLVDVLQAACDRLRLPLFCVVVPKANATDAQIAVSAAGPPQRVPDQLMIMLAVAQSNAHVFTPADIRRAREASVEAGFEKTKAAADIAAEALKGAR